MKAHPRSPFLDSFGPPIHGTTKLERRIRRFHSFLWMPAWLRAYHQQFPSGILPNLFVLMEYFLAPLLGMEGKEGTMLYALKGWPRSIMGEYCYLKSLVGPPPHPTPLLHLGHCNSPADIQSHRQLRRTKGHRASVKRLCLVAGFEEN